MNVSTSSEHSRPGAAVSALGVHYRVWAPNEPSMQVVVAPPGATERRIVLQRAAEGFWEGFDPQGRAGDRYRYQFSDGTLLPDVASRFQPEGVFGPSECIDSAFDWRANWQRPGWKGQTIYEIHLGSFTPEGTYRSAIAKLPHLAELGVEVLEVMPLADFPGSRNWGYDGVLLYAPARCYGRPEELKAFIDAAHQHGLAVILDVVYNHLGPAGNHLRRFSEGYFHQSRVTPWGQSYDLDGPRSRPVREFLVANATYWMDEYRLDGLRLDATHAIPDASRVHILQEIATAIHARGGFVIAEDDRNSVELISPPVEHGGLGLDAAWADDFHHQVRVALTGTRESYYSAYSGSAPALAETIAHGWTYRGQPFPLWQGRPRGADCRHLPPKSFIFCIENHDQVGNRAKGERLEHLVSPAGFRAASAVLCLCPYAPMLLMGQEWAASSPFQFFTDHHADLGDLIREGRRREFGHAHPIEEVPDPQAEQTFAASKLYWDECAQPGHREIHLLYRECLRERRTWLGEADSQRDRWRVHQEGSWIAVRYLLPEAERMLLFTFDSNAAPPAEVFAPPAGRVWHPVLSTEEAAFGGSQPPPVEIRDLRGPIAAWLVALEDDDHGAH